MQPDLSGSYIWAVILGMAVLNFAVRFVPLAVVSRVALPEPVLRWLSFVPISVMGALVASEVFRPAGVWVNPVASPTLYAAVVTGIVYRLSRSFLGATLAGMASFVFLQQVFGAASL